MGLWELFVIALGLSMDAFAVSICKGLSVRRCTIRHMLICGLYFGLFQGAMPLIGYLLGHSFESAIASIDHWIAFALLALIGGNMVREALGDDDEEKTDASFGFKTMLLLSVATSIDALAVGVSFAFLGVNIIAAIATIGTTTFILSIVGIKVGNVFGAKYKDKAELVGGIILILMGLKILLEHLGVISF